MNLANLTIGALHESYRNGETTPQQVIDNILENCRQYAEYNIWITLLNKEQTDVYLQRLAGQSPDTLPLYGIPFAIKDNIDLAGVPTSAACPEYTYVPEQNAFVIQQLLDAGAIPVGKTNMDQFATGLVGTRSPQPWGACHNAFDKDYISGGSSSGSAVALALGLVSFSLGTDTAGSGRVPAAYNNLVGLKPSKGLLSMRGVVPACRSLDCVSIFALNSDDADQVFEQAAVFDAKDDYSRNNRFSNNHRHYGASKDSFSFAVPKQEQLEFFANNDAAELFKQSCEKLKQLGGKQIEIDFNPFMQAARLLYDGPWVTERFVAIEEFIANKPGALLSVTNTIIGSSKEKKTSDAFKAFYQLQHYKRQTDAVVKSVDLIVTPTAGTIYSIDEVNNDPIKLNSNVGHYTNFMNLLDYSAVAVPAGFMASGLPFGITFAADAFEDRKLLTYAKIWQEKLGLKMGKTDNDFRPRQSAQVRRHQQSIDLVVCGAHLQGFPLNWQLTERGGELIESTESAPRYKLYALAGDKVRRPGMFRDEKEGVAIKVEVWRLPVEQFGSFVADIPAPLGIGKVELANGAWYSGFICEPYARDDAVDITHLGGWARYCEELNT